MRLTGMAAVLALALAAPAAWTQPSPPAAAQTPSRPDSAEGAAGPGADRKVIVSPGIEVDTVNRPALATEGKATETPASNGAEATPAAKSVLPKKQPVMPDAVEAEYGYNLRNAVGPPADPPPAQPSVPHDEAAGGFNWMVGIAVAVGLALLVGMGSAAFAAWRNRHSEAGSH